MSLFDFLAQNPNLGPTPDYSGGGFMGRDPHEPDTRPALAMAAPQPQTDPQGLFAPQKLENDPLPAQQPPPEGLLSRFSKPDPTGVSMADRIYAIGSILKGDSAGGMKYLQGQQLAAQKLKDTAAAHALKDKGNQAFRAAYQGGKFDPSTYASMMGDDLDPEAFAKLATAAAPKGSMSGSYAISTNPLGGGIDIQGQRPPDYAENTAAGNSAEQQRHNAVTEQQGAIHAAVAQVNAALAKQREGRVAAKAAGGGADWTHRVIGVGKVQ